jgi:hypothetical protein
VDEFIDQGRMKAQVLAAVLASATAFKCSIRKLLARDGQRIVRPSRRRQAYDGSRAFMTAIVDRFLRQRLVLSGLLAHSAAPSLRMKKRGALARAPFVCEGIVSRVHREVVALHPIRIFIMSIQSSPLWKRVFGALLFPLPANPTFVHAVELTANDTKEIRDVFLRQTAAETAHNIDALDDVMAHAAPGQPDPVSFIARARQFWGRDAVMDHFRNAFTGSWRVEPDESAIRIPPLTGDTVQIYAPTRVMFGAVGEPAKTSTFLINEFAIRTQKGWKISAVIPVPAE